MRNKLVIIAALVFIVAALVIKYGNDPGDQADERFFTIGNYKKEVFPSETSFELVTLENNAAIMLYVILDEKRFGSVKAHPVAIEGFREPVSYKAPIPKPDVMDDYRQLKGRDKTDMYLYRLTYLDKNTNDEKDIAYISGPVLPVFAKGSDQANFTKLMIFDAFVENDLSEFRLLVGQKTDIVALVFRLQNILAKPDKAGYIEVNKDYFIDRVCMGCFDGFTVRFLTPEVVSVTKEFEDRAGKHKPVYKYHLAPTITKMGSGKPVSLFEKLLWCNKNCNYYTFDQIHSIYGIRPVKKWYGHPLDIEIKAFRLIHGFVFLPEPKYNMSEWKGRTRMNRDASWLK
ncbi:MAG: hypothetical protein ILO36_00475 [Abditibacteriota bacterium]|nr:hypothetical protein [Abditibacteriota bacterium]